MFGWAKTPGFELRIRQRDFFKKAPNLDVTRNWEIGPRCDETHRRADSGRHDHLRLSTS